MGREQRSSHNPWCRGRTTGTAPRSPGFRGVGTGRVGASACACARAARRRRAALGGTVPGVSDELPKAFARAMASTVAAVVAPGSRFARAIDHSVSEGETRTAMVADAPDGTPSRSSATAPSPATNSASTIIQTSGAIHGAGSVTASARGAAAASDRSAPCALPPGPSPWSSSLVHPPLCRYPRRPVTLCPHHGLRV